MDSTMAMSSLNEHHATNGKASEYGGNASALSRSLYISDEQILPLNCFSLPSCYHGDLEAVLVPRGLIIDRINHIAEQIPDFIRVRSYENTKSSGQIEIIGWERVVPLKGQNVLIVEDLIDTGATMFGLMQRLRAEGPASIRVATLAVKRAAGAPPETQLMADYIGFNLPDKFVVGFGLDYNQKMRDLDHLCVMSPSGIERHRVA